MLRQPRWLVLLVLLPVAMALSLLAANWQYQRHVARSAMEAQLEQSQQSAAVPVDEVLTPGSAFPDDDRYRVVEVNGVFEPTSTIIRNKSLNDTRGMWVVNSLRTPQGSTILVLRGWLQATPENRNAVVAPAPPAGTVTVTGSLMPSEPWRSPGILSNGEATSLNTEMLCPEPDCYPGYLQLASPEPAPPLQTVPVRGPGLGPHLGYAGQWLIFMILLPVGFVVLLRREVKDEADALPADH